jgi:Pro-kumamolisin, activation domain
LAVAAALSVATAAFALAWVPAVPASASPSDQLVEVPGSVPPAPTSYGAKVVGPAAPSAKVALQAYFRPTNEAELSTLATAVSTPGSAVYHHFLTVSQFAERFGPSSAEVSALDSYLRSKGLSVGALSANRLAQGLVGTATQIDGALGSSLVDLRTGQGGDIVGSTRAPVLPARLASSIAFIDGLDPWVTPQDNLVKLPAANVREPDVRERAASTCSGMAEAGMTPAQLDTAFGFSGFAARGQQGQGETIGLIEYALPDKQAIGPYETCSGASLTIDYVYTNSPPGVSDSEVAADIEVIAALAPKATVVVYDSSQQGTGLGPWDLAVSGSSPGGLPDVISSSWGSCEPDTGMGSAYYQAEEVLFQEAAAQGQTVLVASGDDGSEGCLDATGGKELAVDDPASAPFVTAVGGTASDTETGVQYVWNSHNAKNQGCLQTGCTASGASGGGASTVWPRPSYQPASLSSSPACTLGAEGCREVPDVSALAGDPYAQYCSPSICSGGGWVGFGGTSLAAPSWGVAVLLSENSCATKIGFLNPLLYSEPSLLTGPITSGNNDLTGTHNGLYAASTSGGYSMAGGLGYLGGANVSQGALCGPTGAGGTPPTSATSPPGGTTTTVPGQTSTTAPGPLGPTGPLAPRAAACAKPVNQPVKGKPVALVATEDANGCAGYLVVTQTGALSGFGGAITYGSPPRKSLRSPIVAMAPTPGFAGYWLLAADGQVFAFGDAKLYATASNVHLDAAAVGIAVSPDAKGYWVVARDGSVLAYGDAQYYGSMGGKHLNRPIVGMAAVPSGQGYWLVAADGGVFAFGDALYDGSMGGTHLNSPVVGVSGLLGGDGYRMVASDGGIFSFGAPFYGSLGSDGHRLPVACLAPSVDGKGYYLMDSAGHIFSYGDAVYLGNATH